MVTPAQMKGQDFDLQLSLHSLPWIMGTELATIPRDVPYLRVPHPVPQEAELRQRLAESRHPFRVGVMWAGNPGHVRDSERSLPVAALTRLGHLPGVTWVNLQSRREEVPDLPDRIDVGPLLTNFSATAYVLSQVDLLITVDTAVAHLAGAMGVRTFLMVTFQPDWRWLLERRDSPWYPSLTLYRQPAYGDWDTVVRSIEEDLRRELGVGVSFQG